MAEGHVLCIVQFFVCNEVHIAHNLKSQAILTKHFKAYCKHKNFEMIIYAEIALAIFALT